MLDAADQFGWMKFPVESHDPLANVLGQIADTLEVVRDPQRSDDLPQVDGHRLPAGDRQHGFFLDLRLQRIDFGSGGHGPRRAIGVALREGINGIRTLLLRATTYP